MTLTQTLIIMNSSIFVVMIIVMVSLLKKNKIKLSGKAELVKRNKIHNKYVKYYNSVLLRRPFRDIVTLYSTIDCYSEEMVKEQSVTVFESAGKVVLLLPIISAIVFQNVVLAMLMSFGGLVYYNTVIKIDIQKVTNDVKSELADSLQSISQIYQAEGNIPAAIRKCDKGKYLEKPLMQIYEALTAVNGQEKLELFTKTTPIRQLKTLAELCFVKNTVGESGDEESKFCEEITLIWQELDSHIRRAIRTRIAFKSLNIVTIVGLICQPIVDIFIVKIMPGTSVIIKGMYGNIEKVILILAVIIIYYVINTMTDPAVVNQVDKVWFIDNLSKKRFVKEFIKRIVPKKFKTREKLNYLIKDSISSKTLEYIYTAKVVLSSATFAVTFILLILFMVSSKSYLKHNYKSLTFQNTSTSYTEEQFKQIKAVDKEYMSKKEKIPDEDAYKLVKARVKGMNEMTITNEVARLSTKYDKLHNMGFKWYYILLAYLAAVGAWFGPEISLKFRKSMAQYEAIEDVMQLQTMSVVLSSTDMSAKNAIYWLANQASVHKAPLRYAFHEYCSNPELALKHLKDSSMIADFKNLVSCLQSAMYTLSLKEAFMNMKLVKSQSLAKQDMIQSEILESKILWGKILAKIPLAIVLFLGFLGPVGFLAITQLGSMITQLNGSGLT